MEGTKDEIMKEAMIEKLEEFGIKKDQINDYMIWGVKKLMLGVMKIKWSIKESGMEEKEGKEQLQNIVDKVTSMDAEDLHEMMHDNCGECDWSKSEQK